MWLLFGIVAIIMAFCNWIWGARGKNPEVFCYLSLSATALTVCGFYQQNTDWALAGDYGAILDTAGVATALWVLVVLSILINGATLLVKEK
ncbi:hypothetical protein RFF05_00445 [Bengtsoniella intestinalis]|uniref:hypothetical protein n=1 Tax=Bengtsoniella intestinalis TaxID=3073143 RepID=UPI00391F7566